jgi:fructose transport system permease protein
MGIATTDVSTPQESPWAKARHLYARQPVLGPFGALVLLCVFFSLASSTFLSIDNFSTILQQIVVVATLALGQTLIILTAGIDLANGAILVLGTLIMAKVATGGSGSPVLGLILGLIVCVVVATASGLLVTSVKLPPFIVTLGMLAVVVAIANLYSGGTTTQAGNGLLTWLGTTKYLFGRAPFTYGIFLAAVLYIVVGLLLAKTAWGKHVYAVGGDIEAARLTGIRINRTTVSVYALAGLVYGFGAWLALGRAPTADPNAYQTGNLDSITAVVIGGTSLFGGRGGVVGTVIGALIVAVLRSGLTQMGIDSNYQNLATGALVILAVAFDQATRRVKA